MNSGNTVNREFDPAVQARLLAAYGNTRVPPPRQQAAPEALIGPLAERAFPPPRLSARDGQALQGRGRLMNGASSKPSLLLRLGGVLTTLALVTTLVVGILGLSGVIDGKLVGSINVACYGFTACYFLSSTLHSESCRENRWMLVGFLILTFVPIIFTNAYGVVGAVSVYRLGMIPITMMATAAVISFCAFSCLGCCSLAFGIPLPGQHPSARAR